MLLFWKSKTGKLVATGCGTQAGTVLTCGILALSSLFCVVCVFANGLSFSLTQKIAGLSTTAPVEAASFSGEIDPLLKEVDLLLDTVDSLQANPPVTPLPTALPAPSQKPVAVAKQSEVNLHSGPSVNYKQVGILPLGEIREIIGRNSNSTWWIITMTDGGYAWVCDTDVTTFNVNDLIPTVTTPAELGESSTERRQSMWVGTSPKCRLSRRKKQSLLSFCQGT